MNLKILGLSTQMDESLLHFKVRCANIFILIINQINVFAVHQVMKSFQQLKLCRITRNVFYYTSLRKSIIFLIRNQYEINIIKAQDNQLIQAQMMLLPYNLLDQTQITLCITTLKFIFSDLANQQQMLGVGLRQNWIGIILSIQCMIYMYKHKVSMSRVLIIVDVQNDFCQGGFLAVPQSLEIIPLINKLKKINNFFSHVLITKDWHPLGHISFASTHNKRPFTSIEVKGKVQELWPEHCVFETKGAQLHPLLEVDHKQIVITKGSHIDYDSYSGFQWDAEKKEIKNPFSNMQVEQVYVCGLAFDFCVGSTALDAQKLGYKTFIIEDATKSVSPETQKIMRKRLQQSEVKLISSKDLKL